MLEAPFDDADEDQAAGPRPRRAWRLCLPDELTDAAVLAPAGQPVMVLARAGALALMSRIELAGSP
jgi:hypothetical protein